MRKLIYYVAPDGASHPSGGRGRRAGQRLSAPFRLKVNPLVLGDGIPLIGAAAAKPGAPAMPLTRRRSRAFASGVTYAEYVRST